MNVDILNKFKTLEENFYLDSMTESDSDLMEQADEEVEAPEQPAPQGADPAMADPAMGGGMEGMEGMEGEGGMGMGMEEEIKTPTELGRVYELNKIYYRLYVINKHLKNTSDERLQKLKKMVSQAFDIYRLILNNIKSYKDKVDEVILQFYEFISNVVIQLNEYYKRTYKKSVQDQEQT
jgi:hypothetical protein